MRRARGAWDMGLLRGCKVLRVDASRSVSSARDDATVRVATKLSPICPKASWIGHRTRPVVL